VVDVAGVVLLGLAAALAGLAELLELLVSAVVLFCAVVLF